MRGRNVPLPGECRTWSPASPAAPANYSRASTPPGVGPRQSPPPGSTSARRSPKACGPDPTRRKTPPALESPPTEATPANPSYPAATINPTSRPEPAPTQPAPREKSRLAGSTLRLTAVRSRAVVQPPTRMRALTIGTNALAPAIPPSTFPTPGVDYPARDIAKTGKPAPPATTLGNNPFKDDYAALGYLDSRSRPAFEPTRTWDCRLTSTSTRYRQRDRKVLHNNLQGTRNVFEATVAADRPSRLVYTSSVAAYGYHADNPMPITEDVPTRGSPEHYYSEQKAACESALVETTADSSLEVFVLRPCIVAGPKAPALAEAMPWRQLPAQSSGSPRRGPC